MLHKNLFPLLAAILAILSDTGQQRRPLTSGFARHSGDIEAMKVHTAATIGGSEPVGTWISGLAFVRELLLTCL
jgi:hypothetical protein